MSAPVTQQVALQVIRTWAAFERDHPEMHVLVPEHVLKICDEALGIDSEKIPRRRHRRGDGEGGKQ